MLNPNFVSRWAEGRATPREFRDHNKNNNDSSFVTPPPPQQQQNTSSHQPSNTNNTSRTPSQSNNKYIFQRDQPLASTANFGSIRKVPHHSDYDYDRSPNNNNNSDRMMMHPSYSSYDPNNSTSVIAPMQRLDSSNKTMMTVPPPSNYDLKNDDDTADVDYADVGHNSHFENQQEPSSSLQQHPNRTFEAPNRSVSRSGNNNNKPASFSNAPGSFYNPQLANHQQIADALPPAPQFPIHKSMSMMPTNYTNNSNNNSNNNFRNFGGNNVIPFSGQRQQEDDTEGVDMEPLPTHSKSKLERFRSNRRNSLGESGPPQQQNNDDDDGRDPSKNPQQQLQDQLDELDLLLFASARSEAQSKLKQHKNSHNKKHDVESTASTTDSNIAGLPSPPLSEKDTILFHKLMQRKVLWVRRSQHALFDWAAKLQAYEQALNEREARLADTETQRANAYQERVLALTEAESMLRKVVEKNKRIGKHLQAQLDEQEKHQRQQKSWDDASSAKTSNDFAFSDRFRNAVNMLERGGGGVDKSGDERTSSAITPRTSSASDYYSSKYSNNSNDNDYQTTGGGDASVMTVAELSPTSGINSPPKPTSSTSLPTPYQSSTSTAKPTSGGGGPIKSALRAPSYNLDQQQSGSNFGPSSSSGAFSSSDGGAEGGAVPKKKTAFVVG